MHIFIVFNVDLDVQAFQLLLLNLVIIFWLTVLVGHISHVVTLLHVRGIQ